MIGDLAILIFVVGLIATVKGLGIGSFFNIGDQGALAFGFVLLASYLAGRIARRAKLPMITGYLLAGILFGPFVMGSIAPALNILSFEVLGELNIFNSIALGLIAFSAGGEMKIESLTKRLRSIISITLGQSLAAFTVLVPLMLLFGGMFAAFSGVPQSGLLAGGLLLAVLATANSPSTAIALIVEYRAKGPLTTTVLGVTVLKDVAVIILFSVAMIAAELLTGSAGSHSIAATGGLVAWEVFGSIGFGLLLGYLMGQYMTYVGRELPLILLALSFGAVELAREMHLSGLLICMSAGFYVENYTKRGNLLIDAIERYSLPVFILFFTITGANLKLGNLATLWPLVLAFFAVRLGTTWFGTWAGSTIAGDEKNLRTNLWTGFVPQAGVTLGLATLISDSFTVIGAPIKTTVIAAVALNQIFGPVLFRWGLFRSGEANVEPGPEPNGSA
jgi:Kef-type K+ transport system membrane component KefB